MAASSLGRYLMKRCVPLPGALPPARTQRGFLEPSEAIRSVQTAGSVDYELRLMKEHMVPCHYTGSREEIHSREPRSDHDGLGLRGG